MNPFKQFNRSILKTLGLLWNKVHALENMRGDGFINIKRSGAGTSIGLNLVEVMKRVSRKQDISNNTRMFQVWSWAESVTFEEEIFSPLGVYNCIEKSVGDTLFTVGFDEWDSGTMYSADDIVEVITDYTDATTTNLRKSSRIYKARETNTNKLPANNPDIWTDLTFRVFNTSEQFIDNGSVNWPKLARFDIILASSSIDTDGEFVLMGNDVLGQTRVFYLDPDATVTVKPVCNIVFGFPSAFNIGLVNFPAEGELGYNVDVIEGDWSIRNWATLTDKLRVIGVWVNGVWFMQTQVVEIDTDKGLEFTLLKLGVKVDESTIDFNGSGELEQIP